MSVKSDLREAQEEIKELKSQLNNTFVERVTYLPNHSYGYYGIDRYHTRETRKHELTLLGKVDAIAQHLGLEFEVEQRKTKVSGPSVKITKQKVKETKKKVSKK